jgi:hypothetical protein
MGPDCSSTCTSSNCSLLAPTIHLGGSHIFLLHHRVQNVYFYENRSMHCALTFLNSAPFYSFQDPCCCPLLESNNRILPTGQRHFWAKSVCKMVQEDIFMNLLSGGAPCILIFFCILRITANFTSKNYSALWFTCNPLIKAKES